MKKTLTLLVTVILLSAYSFAQSGGPDQLLKKINHKVLGIGSISTIVPNSDWSKVAFAGSSGNIYFYDLGLERIIDTIFAFKGRITSLAWSPDDNKIAASTKSDYLANMCIWDLSTEDIIDSFSVEGTLSEIKWSPDGTKIVGINIDDSYSYLKIWDVESGDLIADFENSRWGLSMDWSPDSKKIAIGFSNSVIHVWDVKTGSDITFDTYRGRVNDVAFSPDGTKLAVCYEAGSFYGNGSFALLDLGLELLTEEYITYSLNPSSVAWNPEGTKIACSTEGYSIYIAELGKGITNRIQTDQSFVHQIFWKPDGSKILSFGYPVTLQIWDPESAEFRTAITNDQKINIMKVSPEGSKIATTGDDYRLEIWDAKTGDFMLEIDSWIAYTLCLAWSPDGRKLVTGDEWTYVRIFDTETGFEIMLMDDHIRHVVAVAWSPDGKFIASGDLRGIIKIWDAENGEEISSIDSKQGEIQEIKFFPDSKRIISRGKGSDIKTWDTETGKQIDAWSKGSYGSIYLSPDFTKFVTKYHGEIRIIDVQTGNIINKIKSDAKISSMLWSHDGEKIAAISYGIKIWDSQTLEEIKYLRYYGLEFNLINWFPESNILLSNGWDETNDRIIMWGTDKLKPLSSQDINTTGKMNSISWRYDSKIIVGGGTGDIEMWNVDTPVQIQKREKPFNETYSIEYSPDYKMIAVAGEYDLVKILDSRTLDSIKAIGDKRKIVYSLSWSPDGKKIVTGGKDTVFTILDVESGEALYKMKIEREKVKKVSWNPKSNLIIVQEVDWDDVIINIWDGNSGTLIENDIMEDKIVYDFCWSPDGKKAAFSTRKNKTDQKSIEIWNADTRTIEKKITMDSILKTDNIQKIDWGPDGNRILFSSYSDKLYILDINKEKLLFSGSAHNQEITDVKWSPNGKKVASSSLDGTIRVWNTDDIVSAPEEMAYDKEVEVYPNPFYDKCIIRYELEQAGNVHLRIFNSVGEPVKAINFGYQAAGMHRCEFRGTGLPSGMYYFTLQSGGAMRTGILSLVK